ncbi:MAG: BpuSI family type II restriction endonuclease [Omnitrophica bacterium]|nr:BpuSI family type II restriction endonuclease [Candidatus Omnitrophota bacterium]
MPRPILPSYSSPENTVFHPAFKYAVEEAIARKGLTGTIDIKGQYPTPTGPADFALFNNSTQRVLMPIEIKRTQGSARGPGRRQARDYWVNLGRATPFYCVSNLELTELFRNDTLRPRTSAQLLKLSNAHAGQLGVTQPNDLYDNLILCMEEILDLLLGISSPVYVTGLVEFQAHIENVIGNASAWHKIFIPACYEYIRGAASLGGPLSTLIASWRAADFFKNNPQRLNQLGSAVDFEHIFKIPDPDPNDPIAFAQIVLKELYESGKALGQGDDIAELVNEALAPAGLGIIETDVELAQLLSVVARVALGRDLKPNEEVVDPAAGSGRILTALLLTAFPGLTPRQVRAIEKEQLFAESLSLRLGLAFAPVISAANSPTVTISPIESINPSEFENVRIVSMNPPFMSGVQAASLKGSFVSRIRAVSGRPSVLSSGQIALEALFLELIWHLVKPETIIATVFPFQHLSRRSDEVVALRRFLAETFALTHIVVYPSAGLFQEVIKQTVLLVGKKGATEEDVKVVEIQKRVADVDFSEMLNQMLSGSLNPTHGVLIKSVPRCDLMSSISDGWKGIFGSGALSQAFLQKYMSSFSSIEDLGSANVTRGSVGNHGNTKLTVFNSPNPRYLSVFNLIPPLWLKPVLNKTVNMPRDLTPTNAPQMSFVPPPSAYQAGTAENQTLRSIVQKYLLVYVPPRGSQTRRVKTEDEIISDLQADQRVPGSGWVLIQRASRTQGEIGLLEHNGILLSTNVPMVKLPTDRERKLLASWVLSVFGQMQLNILGTSQEGMRKLEISSIKGLLYPDFSVISAAIAATLLSTLMTEPALSFNQIQQRSSDQLWAEVVDPADSTTCLVQAFEIFQQQVEELQNFGNT